MTLDLLLTLSNHRKYFYFALLSTNWVKSHTSHSLSSSHILSYLNITSSTSCFSHVERSHGKLCQLLKRKNLSRDLDTFKLNYHILRYFHISFRNTKTSSTSCFSHVERSHGKLSQLLKRKNLSRDLDTFKLNYHILRYFHISFRNTISDDLQIVCIPLNDTGSFVNFIKS